MGKKSLPQTEPASCLCLPSLLGGSEGMRWNAHQIPLKPISEMHRSNLSIPGRCFCNFPCNDHNFSLPSVNQPSKRHDKRAARTLQGKKFFCTVAHKIIFLPAATLHEPCSTFKERAMKVDLRLTDKEKDYEHYSYRS